MMDAPSLAPADAAPYAALTLAERAALLAGRSAPSAEADPLAEWRLGEWTAQAPFGEPGMLAERLAPLGLDEEAFRALVATPAAALRDLAPGGLPWARRIEEALEGGALDAEAERAVTGSFGLYAVLFPFLRDSAVRLARAAGDAAAGAEGEPPFDAARVADLFVPALLGQLAAVFGRLLALEVNVARMQGLLSGSTAAEQVAGFVALFRDPARLPALLAEYAGAARLAATLCDQWLRASSGLLRRLAADRAAIEDGVLGGRSLGRLVEAKAGVGDRHCDGLSVAILRFDSGARVVYKPRSLKVDAAFAALLARLEAAGTCPAMRVAGFVERDGYGWVEFVEAAPCASARGVERFYERLGGLLAVFHVLDGTDMHMENLIAAGEHPVIVDLETLFHPPLDELTGVAGEGAAEGVQRRAPAPFGWTEGSVLKVSMLPQRIWVREGGKGFDVSAVAGRGGETVPGGGIRIREGGDGDVRAARVDTVVSGADNLPTLDGAEADPAAHADALERGFAAVYRALAAERDASGPAAVVRGFVGCPVRVILRPTQKYVALLRESYHPDVLQDGLDRDRFFDRLWVESRNRPALRRVAPHEQEALHRADVPAFYGVVGTRSLVSDMGHELPDFFGESGYYRVVERVRGLDERDLARQLRAVRGAMSTLVEPTAGEDGAPPLVAVPAHGGPAPFGAVSAPAGDPPFLEAALAIADRLAETALHGRDSAAWITVARRPTHANVAVTLYDLYSGLPGVLLFLDALRAVDGRDRHAALRRRAHAALRDVLENGGTMVREVGAFGGLGGTLPALDAAADQDPVLAALRTRVVDRIAERIREETSTGVFDGLAGAVVCLLARTGGEDGARRIALALAAVERILEVHAPDAAPAELRQTFVHGNAGVAWALLRAAAATGDEGLRRPGLELLEHARACGAAPLDLLPALAEAARGGDAEWTEAARWAAADVLRAPRPAHHALDGGILGALEALSLVPALLPDGAGAALDALAAEVAEEVAAGRWRCGSPLGFEGPGLMEGLAGIGLALLRRARPDVVAAPGLGRGAASAPASAER